jgi:hypothetical protein
MIRLLRQGSTDDFELISFTSQKTPPYAILSHTWTEGAEVTYDELVAGAGLDKSGYDKIRFCGKRAALNDLEYFWVDNCCINKNSSAELSESINSMYRWYQEADVCYAYIEDWPSGLPWAELASVIPIDGGQSPESNDEQSGNSNDEQNPESYNEQSPESDDEQSPLSDDEQSQGSDDEQSLESNEYKETRPKRAISPQARLAKRFKFQETRDCPSEGDVASEVSSELKSLDDN